MAKVRVYELAKELSMDSKELVEKLKAGGIPIKNYMSTLDEQAVAKAREVALGVVSEVIEEEKVMGNPFDVVAKIAKERQLEQEDDAAPEALEEQHRRMRHCTLKFPEVFFRDLMRVRPLFQVGGMQATVEGHTLRIPGAIGGLLLSKHYEANYGILTAH